METALQNKTPSSSGSFLRKIAILGLCYVIIAWLTIEFVQRKPFLSIFDSTTPVIYQILIGLAIGIGVGAIQAMLLRYWTWWRELQSDIADKNPGLFRSPLSIIISISLIVGITEEIMFRAAIQPIVGIWLASIFFTAVHLNFDFSAIKKSDLPFIFLSVGMVFIVSLIMGVLFAQFGLFTSIAAHTIYDAIVLFAYRNLLSAVKLNSDAPASKIA